MFLTLLLHIEGGEAEVMNVSQLIDNFANLKAQRVEF
jgi:hypothetical protein